MKARIPHKERWNKNTKQAVAGYIKERLDEEHEAAVGRILKVVCVMLNENFNFGHDRLSKFLNAIHLTANDDDEAYWEHVDHEVIDRLELGEYFTREKIGINGEFLK